MRQTRLSRRRFGTVAALGITAALAGCTGDDNGDDDENVTDDTADDVGDDDEADNETDDNGDDADDFDEDDLEDDPVGELLIILENEDGDPVSSGVEITVDPANDNMSYGAGDPDIEDGEAIISVDEPDDYTVTVESTDDAFETQEEEVTVGEDDVEVEFTLEGAAGDEEDGGDDE